LSLKNNLLIHFLPFAKANKLSSQIIQQSDYSIQINDFLLILTNSILYLFIGILCFKFAEKHAKNHGTLGMH
jgi:hypothetical protein